MDWTILTPAPSLALLWNQTYLEHCEFTNPRHLNRVLMNGTNVNKGALIIKHPLYKYYTMKALFFAILLGSLAAAAAGSQFKIISGEVASSHGNIANRFNPNVFNIQNMN